ncbi:MAG TPA: hypothetical protein VI485_09105 [Vicinamibacterales bacterium]|nr:hypothetical protein [Vicinamibacterales bacterium]
MKLRASPSPATLQLNLPMRSVASSVLPAETRAELVLALVELLVQAAQPPLEESRDGGADEYETHR